MSKFKAGDKVRCVDNAHCSGSLVLGRNYTVRKASETHVSLEEDSSGRLWFSHRFELVEATPSNPSPVRKVTRTEIVPGTYGAVELIDRGEAGFFIRYNEYASAPELRNAARIFNEIADALEQNKEAS
ncbi:MAG: hypothetical protein M9944_12720 [Rhizobiaceae bacterium]|nr:hypothetical protein [Rhizobiaceae bacterium]